MRCRRHAAPPRARPSIAASGGGCSSRGSSLTTAPLTLSLSWPSARSACCLRPVRSLAHGKRRRGPVRLPTMTRMRSASRCSPAPCARLPALSCSSPRRWRGDARRRQRRRSSRWRRGRRSASTSPRSATLATPSGASRPRGSYVTPPSAAGAGTRRRAAASVAGSAMSRLYLGYISAISRLCLGYVSQPRAWQARRLRRRRSARLAGGAPVPPRPGGRAARAGWTYP